MKCIKSRQTEQQRTRSNAYIVYYVGNYLRNLNVWTVRVKTHAPYVCSEQITGNYIQYICSYVPLSLQHSANLIAKRRNGLSKSGTLLRSI